MHECRRSEEGEAANGAEIGKKFHKIPAYDVKFNKVISGFILSSRSFVKGVDIKFTFALLIIIIDNCRGPTRPLFPPLVVLVDTWRKNKSFQNLFKIQ